MMQQNQQPWGSPAAPSVVRGLQQEVAWNPAQVYVDLQAACQVLSDRGWKLAAKFAAELWMGLPGLDMMDCENLVPQDVDEDLLAASSTPTRRPPMLAYAQTLMDLGEFAHAAAVLSQSQPSTSGGATVERMPPPLEDLSPAAMTLRAYAMYMAGERRKEEAYQEDKK
jgi:hypothetical protein